MERGIMDRELEVAFRKVLRRACESNASNDQHLALGFEIAARIVLGYERVGEIKSHLYPSGNEDGQGSA